MNMKAARIEALANLSDYYHAIGNNDRAYELAMQTIQLKDTLIAETNTRQINMLGAMYERESQEKKIASLQSERELQKAESAEQSLLNKLFIASIVALLGLGYLGFTNFRKGQQLAQNQQELQRQKISELEKDKQLLGIDAMMKGQEEERGRIAKDLHDGLGGLLSGTKLSLMTLKDKLTLSPEEHVQFDKSLSMLDNTMEDLRKVAQNLMPGALMRYGLYEALRDFCEHIQFSTGIRMIYERFGEPSKPDKTAAVFIYRIVQELVNNAVKHAEASQIIVQLTTNGNMVRITVEDDGKGFDKRDLYTAKGAGMTNINYRVTYLHGQLDVQSSPGNGTSINIELTI
jgi:signal transduction histidine kinase